MKMLLLLAMLGVEIVDTDPRRPTPAELPTGSVLLMHSDNVVGRVARRVLDGDRYTHAAIVIDGQVYEADWPAVQVHPAATYRRPATEIVVYVPRRPFTPAETAAMRAYAVAHLGQPYGLKTFFAPRTRPNGKTWCSRFVKDALNVSGRYELTEHQGREPHNLAAAIIADYVGPLPYQARTTPQPRGGCPNGRCGPRGEAGRRAPRTYPHRPRRFAWPRW
jgi:hypothetical protein